MTAFEEEVETIVGQFCYAFGAGAERVRVSRETIEVLQTRYRPYLTTNLQTDIGRRAWADAKYHLLECLTTMGRYAASLALQGGHMTIQPEHFAVAAKRFETGVHRSRRRKIKAGIWCPNGASVEGTSVLQPQSEFLGGGGSQLAARG